MITNHDELREAIAGKTKLELADLVYDIVCCLYDFDGELDGAKEIGSDEIGGVCNVLTNAELAPEEL